MPNDNPGRVVVDLRKVAVETLLPEVQLLNLEAEVRKSEVMHGLALSLKGYVLDGEPTLGRQTVPLHGVKWAHYDRPERTVDYLKMVFFILEENFDTWLFLRSARLYRWYRRAHRRLRVWFKPRMYTESVLVRWDEEREVEVVTGFRICPHGPINPSANDYARGHIEFLVGIGPDDE